jgi:carbamoyl-phosphate synthase large subunit
VIAKERPDALLPQWEDKPLSIAVALAKNGALEKYGVELMEPSYRQLKSRRPATV